MERWDGAYPRVLFLQDLSRIIKSIALIKRKKYRQKLHEVHAYHGERRDFFCVGPSEERDLPLIGNENSASRNEAAHHLE